MNGVQPGAPDPPPDRGTGLPQRAGSAHRNETPGLELEGRGPIEGDRDDGVTGRREMRVEIAMMQE
jgi:hypothetical protein